MKLRHLFLFALSALTASAQLVPPPVEATAAQVTAGVVGAPYYVSPRRLAGFGSGTVTSVSVTTANGVSGSVATATTTPAISLTLGAITPTTVSTGALTFTTGVATTSLIVGAAAGSSPSTTFQVVDTGAATPRGITNSQYSTGTESAQFNAMKARGTFAVPTTIVTGDILGRFIAWGHDGSNFINSGDLRFTSEGTIASTRVPSKFEIFVSTNAAPSVSTLTAAFSGKDGIALTAIGNNQNISLSASGTGMVQQSRASAAGGSVVTYLRNTTTTGYGSSQVENNDGSAFLSMESYGSSSSVGSILGAGSAGLALIRFNATSNAIATFSNVALRFGTNSTERMRISAGGNLLGGGQTTDNSNGAFQLSSTSSTTGLALGARAAEVIYRPAINDTLKTDSTWNVAGAELQTNGNRVNYNLSVYGAGTAYALTNTAAAIDFGTTDPVKVLDKAGTYLISAQVHLAYNAATVVAETATIKVRRTNNTAADLSAVVVLDLPVSTTLTHTYGIFQIPPFIYTTTATDDSVTIFANVSAGLGAGTIDSTAIGTSLMAVRLY